MSRSLATVMLLATFAVARGDDMFAPAGEFVPAFAAEFQDLEFNDDRIYLFGVSGLSILDASDPVSPWLVGRYEPPGHPFERYYRGAVSGEYAYCGAREDRLQVIELAAGGAAPIRVAVLGTPGLSYEGVAVRGSLLVTARHDAGVEVFSLADPALPVPVGTIEGLVNAWDVAMRDEILFVADGAGGLAVFDIGDPTAPIHLASLPTAGAAQDLVLQDDLVLLACGSAGVEIFDASVPATPFWLGNHDSAGMAVNLALADEVLYLADWSGVEAVGLAVPASPTLIGREEMARTVMGIAAVSELAIASAWSRLRTFELGPTDEGDIAVPEAAIAFGVVPLGVSADTTFQVGNTGGGELQVSAIETFNPAFQVLPPSSFTLSPGDTRTVTLRFSPTAPGFDATFLRLISDDPDEGEVSFPLTADDDPTRLDIGEPAPDFSLQDLAGVTHNLSDYLGRVVVLAFFANW